MIEEKNQKIKDLNILRSKGRAGQTLQLTIPKLET